MLSPGSILFTLEVTRAAYFLGIGIFFAGQVFFMFLPLPFEVNNGLFIDNLGFMAVNNIKKYLLGLTESNIITLTLISALLSLLLYI